MSQQVRATWSAQNLGLWPAGFLDGSNLSPVLVGPKWNIPSASIGGVTDLVIPGIDFGLFTTPPLDLGKTGAEVNFGGSGEMGFLVTPQYSGGSMNLNYSAGVSLSFPEFPSKGDQVTVTAQFVPGTGSYFTTTSPTFGVGLAAVVEAKGNASTDGYFLGKQLWNDPNFINIDVEAPGGGPQVKQLTSNVIPLAVEGLNALGQALATKIPITFSVAVPDLSANGSVVASDGSIDTTAFGTFFSADTNVMAWVSLLLDDDAANLSQLLDVSTSIPGTNLNVSWDIADIYADMNVGFYSHFTLTPQSTLAFNVYDQNGQLLATSNSSTTGSTSATFTMPAGGVTIQPQLALNFNFHNRLSVGFEGTFGINPFNVSCTGTLGSGANAQTIDFVANVGDESYTTPVGATPPFLDKQFLLPGINQPALASMGINTANNTALPNYVNVNGQAGNIDAQIQAYVIDTSGSGSDTNFKTIDITPPQGFRFFAQSPSFNVTMSLYDPKTGVTTDLGSGAETDTDIQAQIPQSLESPGQKNLTVTVHTKNLAGTPISASYRTLMEFYEEAPIISGQFYIPRSANGPADPTYNTNRIVANGQDQTIYCQTNHVFSDTKAVLNTPTGQVYLPTSKPTDQDLQGLPQLAITIPAWVASAYAGGPMTIQLVNPNVQTKIDGTAVPPTLSNAAPIYFVAGKPSISQALVGGTNSPVLVGDKDAHFDLTGSNLTQLTTVAFTGPNNLKWTLPTVYSSPTRLHVTFPASVLQAMHNIYTLSGNLTASTPSATVPSDSANDVTVSGGTSSPFGIKLDYLAPAISQITPNVLIRGVQNTFSITGTNLFIDPTKTNASATDFVIKGARVPHSEISYSNKGVIQASTVTFVIPANDPSVHNVGQAPLQATNHNSRGKTMNIAVQNGLPEISGLGSVDIKVGPGIANTFTVPGGPFYPESTATIGSDIPPSKNLSLTSQQVTVGYGDVGSIQSKIAYLNITTPAPGGGISNPLRLNLLERDPSTITVTSSTLIYDKTYGTWDSKFTLTYTGKRSLNATAELLFSNLSSGLSIQNSDGTDSGSPYKNVTLSNGQTTNVTVRFLKGNPTKIAYTTAIKFTN